MPMVLIYIVEAYIL